MHVQAFAYWAKVAIICTCSTCCICTGKERIVATKTRSLRLDDATWDALQRLAEDAGLSTRTKFVESVAQGTPTRPVGPAEVKLVEVEKIVYVEAPRKNELIYFPELREVLRLTPAKDRALVEGSDELVALLGRLYEVFCRATESENK